MVIVGAGADDVDVAEVEADSVTAAEEAEEATDDSTDDEATEELAGADQTLLLDASGVGSTLAADEEVVGATQVEDGVSEVVGAT
jgi:hypothetical protein